MISFLSLILSLSTPFAHAQFPVFELSGVEPNRIEGELSMESMSNRNGALYFQVEYSGTDELMDRFRTFMVVFEVGALNPAPIGNATFLMNLKVYPLTRFNEIDGAPVAVHLGTTSFQSDYSLGLNGLASIKLLGFSTRSKLPVAEEFYIGVSAQALGAYLFRSYSQDKLGPNVYNKGFSMAYFDVAGEIGADFGKTKDGDPLLHVTLMSAQYEMGDQINLGQLYTEISAALADDSRIFFRFGRRWINDPTANVNGNFTDWVRLGVSKPWK